MAHMAVKASLVTCHKCLVNNLKNTLNTFNTVINDMSVSQVDTFIVIVPIHCNEIMQIQFFKCKHRVLKLHVKWHNALKSKLTYSGRIYFRIKHLEDMRNFVLIGTFSSLFVQWKLHTPNMLCDIYWIVLSVTYSKFSYIPLNLPCACL